MAVALLVGAAAGSRDTGADQRDHQVARHRAGRLLGRRHHFGHRHRPHSRAADPDPGRRGQPEPAVGRVIQRPQVLGGVHRLSPVMQQGKTAPDDGVAHFTDRHRARHRTRPAQSHQAVFPGELVDGGAAVHPVHAAPQREGLGVAQQLADPAVHDQPLTERAVEGLDLGARFRRADHGPLGQQVPRPLALGRVRRIFLVDGELVAHPPVGDQLAAIMDQRPDRPTTRVDRRPTGSARWQSRCRSTDSQPDAGPAGSSR